MTVYNEAEFIDYAIQSCLSYVDHLVIVEGAYQETIAVGGTPRSHDGTYDLIEKYRDNPKVSIIYANAQSDKDQRNLGLEKIKELNPDGWFMIIDGDEVYEPSTFKMIQVAINNMEKTKKYAAYFKSFTFVNDLRHYTEQEFPRLFKITPGVKFTNDNFVAWEDQQVGWFTPYVIKIPYINYFHYSFCKGKDRFELKKKWWETRFGKPFDYGWKVNEQGKIEDPDHEIYEFTGQHPQVMKNHPLWEKDNG